MDPAGEQRIFHLLQVAAHRVKTEGDRLTLQAAGVSAAQAAVLFVVRKTPGATQRAVAEALKLRESAVTAMIARLLRAGLLTRTPDPDDRRAWRLQLTEDGSGALTRFRPALDDLNRQITAALGGADAVESLARALTAIMELPQNGRPPPDGDQDVS